MGTTLTPPFATAGTHRDRQPIEALAQANRVRLRRASLMRWMHGHSPADSHEKAAELIVEPDPTLYSMLVLQLLQRVRQVGPAQAERMLELADVSPTSYGRGADRQAARRPRGTAPPPRRPTLLPPPTESSAMNARSRTPSSGSASS